MAENSKIMNTERQKSLIQGHQKEVDEIKKRFEASKSALEARFNHELSRARSRHKSQLEALQRSKIVQESLQSGNDTKH